MNTINSETLEFFELSDNLEPNHALDPETDSKLWVDTEHARGDFSFHALYQKLGMNPHTLQLIKAAESNYLLFMGHIGCGKSTELRRLKQTLHDPTRYYVIFFDTNNELDIHNFQYVDLLLVCARKLCEAMEKEQLSVDDVYLERLHKWFTQQVITQMTDKTLSIGVDTELKAGFTWPLIGGLMAKCTNACKYNSTYKKEMREAINNSFAEFANAFNILIDVANGKLKQNNRGHKLLFIIDGTDRLNSDDTKRFFIENINHLKQIRANFLYGAPIHMLFETNALQQNYSALYRLPMIKLFNKDGTPSTNNARATLQEMVFRRIPLKWFDSLETVDYLIDHCGGHPRDLVRLLSLTWQNVHRNGLDRTAANKAVACIASDFKRLLTTEDYVMIARFDSDDKDQGDRTRISKLLSILALLEYDDHWWRSHPVVRTLPGYQHAIKST
ncbi:MAG: AAA family ATPase [Magnetococcus sp. YQC-5]